MGLEKVPEKKVFLPRAPVYQSEGENPPSTSRQIRRSLSRDPPENPSNPLNRPYPPYFAAFFVAFFTGGASPPPLPLRSFGFFMIDKASSSEISPPL
jgi:hypothetical protein